MRLYVNFYLNKDGTGHITIAEKTGGYDLAGEFRQDVAFLRNIRNSNLTEAYYSWNVEMKIQDAGGNQQLLLKMRLSHNKNFSQQDYLKNVPKITKNVMLWRYIRAWILDIGKYSKFIEIP